MRSERRLAVPVPANAAPGATNRAAVAAGPRRDARYDAVAIALHWLVAGAVLFQIGWGWWMQALPKGVGSVRVDAFNLHKSIGLTVLAVMLIRLGWRLAHPPPPLPRSVPPWERGAAAATHGALYVLVLAQPLTGFLGSLWSGYPVRFFGWRLPSLLEKSEPAKELMSTLHGWIGGLIVAVVVLHVVGALKHAIVDRDRVASRMLPGRHTVAPRAGETSPIRRRA